MHLRCQNYCDNSLLLLLLMKFYMQLTLFLYVQTFIYSEHSGRQLWMSHSVFGSSIRLSVIVSWRSCTHENGVAIFPTVVASIWLTTLFEVEKFSTTENSIGAVLRPQISIITAHIRWDVFERERNLFRLVVSRGISRWDTQKNGSILTC